MSQLGARQCPPSESPRHAVQVELCGWQVTQQFSSSTDQARAGHKRVSAVVGEIAIRAASGQERPGFEGPQP
eukprot:810150-Pleurochrysis_carterae.AAC.5